MGKQKTRKALVKRFKVTKTGKTIKKATGQGHFNSRESGKVGRNKRRDKQITGKITKTIKRHI